MKSEKNCFYIGGVDNYSLQNISIPFNLTAQNKSNHKNNILIYYQCIDMSELQVHIALDSRTGAYIMGTFWGTMLLYFGQFYLCSSDSFLVYQNSNRFWYVRCAHSRSAIFNQKPMDVHCCKSWSLCVADNIILTARNVFLLFPWSEQFFFAIYIFAKSNLDEE